MNTDDSRSDLLLDVPSGPLGFVRNLQVTDPTTSTLNVRWEPPEGNVREYIVIWVPAAGGEQDVVRIHPLLEPTGSSLSCLLGNHDSIFHLSALLHITNDVNEDS